MRSLDLRRALSRRSFLRQLGLAGAGFGASRLLPQAFAAAPDRFEDVTAAAGIHWKHVAGLSPEMYMPETAGAGCAFLDYDNDGWMDIYLVNSGKCDFFNPVPPLRNALYRNNRDGTFTDVTEKAGVTGNAYGRSEEHT